MSHGDVTSGQQLTYSQEQTTDLFAGSLADMGDAEQQILSYVNEEASAEMPFGRMLAKGTADFDALLMAAQADALIGVLVHSQAYQKDTELGSTGLKPDVTLNVLTKGRIWVNVTEDVTPASAVRVDEDGGQFRDSAEANVTIDISKNARYLTTALSGTLALLEFNMTGLDANKSSDT